MHLSWKNCADLIALSIIPEEIMANMMPARPWHQQLIDRELVTVSLGGDLIVITHDGHLVAGKLKRAMERTLGPLR